MHCHWQRPLTVFQSVGSREPDPTSKTSSGCAYGFNPQARESLIEFSEEFTEGQISFNPQARESLIPLIGWYVNVLLVSIRRLARA